MCVRLCVSLRTCILTNICVRIRMGRKAPEISIGVLYEAESIRPASPAEGHLPAPAVI